jgi:hypothetical protein
MLQPSSRAPATGGIWDNNASRLAATQLGSDPGVAPAVAPGTAIARAAIVDSRSPAHGPPATAADQSALTGISTAPSSVATAADPATGQADPTAPEGAGKADAQDTAGVADGGAAAPSNPAAPAVISTLGNVPLPQLTPGQVTPGELTPGELTPAQQSAALRRTVPPKSPTVLEAGDPPSKPASGMATAGVAAPIQPNPATNATDSRLAAVATQSTGETDRTAYGASGTTPTVTSPPPSATAHASIADHSMSDTYSAATLALVDPSPGPPIDLSSPAATAYLGDQPATAAAMTAPSLVSTQAPASAPAPAPATPSPPASPANQVAPALMSLATSASGTQSLTLRLEPNDLGTVQVRIDRPIDAPAHVDVSVSRPETLTLLLRDQAQLQHTLDQAGVPAEGRTLSLHLAGQGTDSQSRQAGAFDQSTSDGRAPRLPNQGGTATGNASNDAAASLAPTIATRWQRVGLDITA